MYSISDEHRKAQEQSWASLCLVFITVIMVQKTGTCGQVPVPVALGAFPNATIPLLAIPDQASPGFRFANVLSSYYTAIGS